MSNFKQTNWREMKQKSGEPTWGSFCSLTAEPRQIALAESNRQNPETPKTTKRILKRIDGRVLWKTVWYVKCPYIHYLCSGRRRSYTWRKVSNRPTIRSWFRIKWPYNQTVATAQQTKTKAVPRNRTSKVSSGLPSSDELEFHSQMFKFPSSDGILTNHNLQNF